MSIPASARWMVLFGAGIGVIALSTRALFTGAGEAAEAVEAVEGQKGPTTPLKIGRTTRVRGASLRLGLEPTKQPIAVGVTQAWSVLVADAQGAPLGGCKVELDATMPEHGHGLPTAPRVEAESARGRYRLEGLRFSMPGYWQIDVTASCDEGAESARFELRL